VDTLKLAAFAIVAAFGGAMAYVAHSAGRPEKRMQCSLDCKSIDKFLAKSRTYLGL
jgi:hypothetical protein